MAKMARQPIIINEKSSYNDLVKILNSKDITKSKKTLVTKWIKAKQKRIDDWERFAYLFSDYNPQWYLAKVHLFNQGNPLFYEKGRRPYQKVFCVEDELSPKIINTIIDAMMELHEGYNKIVTQSENTKVMTNIENIKPLEPSELRKLLKKG